MKALIRFVAAAVIAMLFLAGCEKRDARSSASDAPEEVVAVAVDTGSVTSEGNAQRIILSKNGDAASGWARDPSSMRKLKRLTEGQKTDVLRAAAGAVSHVAPGEFAFGSKDGEWLRVVIITSHRKLIYDEAVKKDAASPPADLQTIVNSLLDQANQR